MRPLGYLRIKFLAHQRLRAVLLEGRVGGQRRRRCRIHNRIATEGITIVAEPAEDVECCFVRLDDVVAHAATIGLAKIQMLQLVCLKIRQGKHKHLRPKVQVAANPGLE